MGYHIDIQRFSFMHDYYAIFDAEEFHIAGLLEQHGIKMKVVGSFQKPDCEYVVLYVRIRKKDREDFLTVLDQLEKKLLVLGYMDYPEFCTGIIKQMVTEYEKLKNGNGEPANKENRVKENKEM